MRYLITGVAGFIGSAVASALLNKGHEVLGIDNLNPYYDPALKEARLSPLTNRGDFEFQKLDICERDAIEALFQDHVFDCVIHLAAQAGVRYSISHPHTYTESNITGFLNILEGCRHSKIGHLVYASSSSVYGLNESMPFSVSDNVDHPVSLYAATKKSNELMAHCYAHLYNIPVTGLRFFTVYGPWGRPDMALFMFTKNILEGKPIDVFNNGNHARDFTYIDDIVDGVIKTAGAPPKCSNTWSGDAPDPATSKVPYQLFNIGNGNPVPLLDFISAIEDALGQKAQKNLLPMQPGDVAKTFADVSHLQNVTQYAPKTDIRNGVKNFVDWYKSYYSY